MFVMKGMGGWADEMVGKYFDSRKQMKAIPAETPKEAVEKIFELIGK